VTCYVLNRALSIVMVLALISLIVFVAREFQVTVRAL
jgi:hypothetical protein